MLHLISLLVSCCSLCAPVMNPPLGPATPANESSTDLRSTHSDRRIQVKFANPTSLAIELVWLDFSGRRVPDQEILHPCTAKTVSTYVGHTFIFLDCETGERIFAEVGSKSADGVFEPARFLGSLAQQGELGPRESKEDFLSGRVGPLCVILTCQPSPHLQPKFAR